MSRVYAALIVSAVTAMALPTAASAGCYGCYTPPPCATCYQRQVVPPQYRTVEETVMVAPGGVVAHRTRRNIAPSWCRRPSWSRPRACSTSALRLNTRPTSVSKWSLPRANTTWRCRRAAVPAATERHYRAAGNFTGTCGEVLTTRVLPSGSEWFLSVSSRRKNFSASMVVASFGGLLPWVLQDGLRIQSTK
jgi:hypothetical protein